MPVPTPPKKDLFKVTPPRQVGKPSPRVPGRPSKATQKMSKEIRNLTEAIKDDTNTVPIEEPKQLDSMPAELLKPKANSMKRLPFKPPEHLTQTPFRDNEALRKLSYELKKETDSKRPVKWRQK